MKLLRDEYGVKAVDLLKRGESSLVLNLYPQISISVIKWKGKADSENGTQNLNSEQVSPRPSKER